MFVLMDDIKDWSTSYEDFFYFYKSFNVEKEVLDMIFKDADANGDGIIDYSETYENAVKFYFSV